LRPYTRFELIGWGKLLRYSMTFCEDKNKRWTDAPKKIIRGKLHGYLMSLDLSDWAERQTYFLGRYYELEVQLLMGVILKPSDRFVDIGANIGMISLYAAYLVTENGSVDCFEPNPDCILAIQNHLTINNIKHVCIHPVGLSDKKETLHLHLSSDHTGTATLATIPDPVKSFEVPVLIGDDILLSDSKPIKLIKIDVEGFELNVLKGIKKTLGMFRPMLILEFIEDHFQRAGTSSEEIKEFLTEIGYKPYGISKRRKWTRYRLHLIPLDRNLSDWKFNDILWMHEKSPYSDVIKKYT